MTALVMKCTSAQQHPNADTLRVYKFEAGSMTANIIANLEETYEVGDCAEVVLVNSKLKSGENIIPSKIRGIISQGMALGKTDLDVGTDLTEKHCLIEEGGFSFNKWTDIGSLFNIRKELKATNETRKIKYRGKIKLDGTNAGVQINPQGEVCAQSRTRIITPDDDNLGFAKWVASKTNFFSGMKQDDLITVYGEWCFYHDTPVLLADGTSKKIGEIVRDKLKLDVMTYNKSTQKLEAKKIIGWSKQDDADDWLTITVKRRHRGGKSTRLIVTKNHKIYSSHNGEPFEMEAKYLRPGNKVFVFGKQMSYYQFQFIAGSLLGDGSFDSYGIFNCSHSRKHSFYSKFINDLLSSIISRNSKGTSGFGSDMDLIATQSLPEIKNLYDLLMNHGSKEPSKEYLNQLHPPAFAAWYMDDGSICSGKDNRRPQAELSTLGFNQDTVDDIVEWFNDHNYKCHKLSNGNDQFFIRFTPDGSESFFRMISPYILSDFNYKLPEYLHNSNKVSWNSESDINGIIETEVINIEDGNPYKERHKRYRYDITVEDNHNFFANKVLVHNCGEGIQKRTAVSKIGKKIFAVFAVQVDSQMESKLIFEPELIKKFVQEQDDVYVLPWATEEMELDYTDADVLKVQAEEINNVVYAVEEVDPWVKDTFGVDGMGEGVVIYPLTDTGCIDRLDFSDLVFKAKGEKHKVVKDKEPARIDPIVANSISEFVELFVTENRLEQMAQRVGTFDLKKTAEFVQIFSADVEKESDAELEASGLTWKQVAKDVGRAASKWWVAKSREL